MQLKTILNRVTNYKSFVVGKVRWVEEPPGQALEIELHRVPMLVRSARSVGRHVRAMTGRRNRGVSNSSVVDDPGLLGVLDASCGLSDGVASRWERVPWAEGKSPMTREYRWFLARWAKRMCWKDVAIAFRISWDRVYDAVRHAVSWAWSIVTWKASRPSASTRCNGIGARVPDGGVSTGRRQEAAVVGRQGP